MKRKIIHPFLYLLCIMAMVGLACSFSINMNSAVTQTPTLNPPTDTSTETATPSQTSTTTSTPTFTPTFTATETYTPSPTATSTHGFITIPHIIEPAPFLSLINTPTNTPISKLDYAANSNYGDINLSAGFIPDPHSIGLSTGGSIDVSYLGGSCSGYATAAPDVRVNFGGGGASLLRFYFKSSSSDPTMVVNDPYGNYYCVDDSFGTINPTLDFNSPVGGTYDIWIGSYASGTSISGTLYITQNSGNHP